MRLHAGRWAVMVGFLLLSAACGGTTDAAATEDATSTADVTGLDATGDATTTTGWGVPLATTAPWPKFRRDARQTGRADFAPEVSTTTQPWSFPTGKGIFSSPIVGADETVYVGSASRHFYAIGADGKQKWDLETGEIIDSSGLLDDKGRVYVASGDGKLYARNAATGAEVWTFSADDPKVTGGLINWFEGNVAIAPNGDLVVPNDNFWVYGIDRDTGKTLWHSVRTDQTWSLPALDVTRGLWVQGNNQLLKALGDNVFGFHLDGSIAWSTSTPGTDAASPLVTRKGVAVIGGFDGIIHALNVETGAEVWQFPTRDHVYASAAELSDGTIVVPSSDGTVYALTEDGKLKWAYDTLEPIRSSPAVDGLDRIYFGSGDGRLYVLNPDGTLRFSYRLIADDRNDLNASPALGHWGVYLAGEDGHVFGVPYDFCLRPAEATNPACVVTAGESLPADGVFLKQTTRFGSPLVTPTPTIDPNEALAFSLFVRKAGDTLLAVLDTATLQVTTTPPIPLDVRVSGDRHFFTVVPLQPFVAGTDGHVQVRVQGQWLQNPTREGLKTSGGTVGGPLDTTFTWTLGTGGPAALPLPIAATVGDATGIWSLSRLAAPLPTILPSYNQIGFDSLHWLVGLVHGDGTHAVGWVVGALPSDTAPFIRVDPASKALFPVTVDFKDGAVTLENQEGLALEMMNASLSFNDFRINARFNDQGQVPGGAVLTVTSKCADIQLYGLFLQQLGFCNPDSDLLVAFGAVLLQPVGTGVQAPVTGVGPVTMTRSKGAITVDLPQSTLPANAHRLGILLEDGDTGKPLPIAYGPRTVQHATPGGMLDKVTLDIIGAEVPSHLRGWLLVDAWPAGFDPAL